VLVLDCRLVSDRADIVLYDLASFCRKRTAKDDPAADCRRARRVGPWSGWSGRIAGIVRI